MSPSSPSQKRRGRPTLLSDIVAGIVARESHSPGGARRGAAAIRVFAAFRALGPPITQHAEAVHFRGGVLYVVVDDPTWLTELTFLKGEVLSRLERSLGHPVVKELRMRHGAISARRAKVPQGKQPLPPLGPADARLVEAIGELIPDPTLRAIVQRAAQLNLGHRRAPAQPRPPSRGKLR